jgi:nitrous oxidase accessory protein
MFKGNGAGVAVMYSKHIAMRQNRFERNWGPAAYGLLLKEINDSYIGGNIFTKNTTGIFMESCNRNRFMKNNFDLNGWAINMLADCIDNRFTQNNFLGNTFDIGTNGSLVLNTFNGNYWDKYEGFDLNRDNTGDIPYHPVSMYSMIIESNPGALMLFRSLIVSLLDKSEKLLPGITPENLKDEKPLMRPLRL